MCDSQTYVCAHTRTDLRPPPPLLLPNTKILQLYIHPAKIKYSWADFLSDQSGAKPLPQQSAPQMCWFLCFYWDQELSSILEQPNCRTPVQYSSIFEQGIYSIDIHKNTYIYIYIYISSSSSLSSVNNIIHIVSKYKHHHKTQRSSTYQGPKQPSNWKHMYLHHTRHNLPSRNQPTNQWNKQNTPPQDKKANKIY